MEDYDVATPERPLTIAESLEQIAIAVRGTSRVLEQIRGKFFGVLPVATNEEPKNGEWYSIDRTLTDIITQAEETYGIIQGVLEHIG